MARLLKERARKPIVPNGNMHVGIKIIYGEPHYVIDVYNPTGHAAHTLALSKVEMLRAVNEWTGCLLRAEEVRIREEKRKASPSPILGERQ